MNESMRRLVPACAFRAEHLVHKSRFVASCEVVSSVGQANDFIRRIRAEFPDATHHVPAYLVGHGDSVIAHCHDDGEPSGTAGRPVLAVLQGSGLGDVAVVVTRYFGGTKLGTGGLVRAYSSATKKLLEDLPLGEKVLTHLVSLEFPYRYLERVRRAAACSAGIILAEEFSQSIQMQVRIAVSRYSDFCSEVASVSNGAWGPTIVSAGEDAIVALKVGN